MGSFITAYARTITITAAQANYKRFAYCDTDSLHLMGTNPPQGITVHKSDLGMWAHEGDFDNAFYIRAKGYIEHMTHCEHGLVSECVKCEEWSVHIAGVPENITKRLRFDDIYDNHRLEGKLMPKTVPGGIVLEDGHFTLKLWVMKHDS